MKTYTMQDWANDGTLKLQRGQFISDEVFYQLRDGVPPTTLRLGIFQMGEADCMHPDYGCLLYLTFRRVGELWQYVGRFMELTQEKSFAHILSMQI